MQPRASTLALIMGLSLTSEPSVADSARERSDPAEHSMSETRAIRAWKLIVNLELDQGSAARVFPVLDGFDDRIAANVRARKQIARDIEVEARVAKPSDGRLRALVAGFRENLTSKQAIDRERWQAVRPLLTPLQQLQMLWLLPRLEQRYPQRLPRGPNRGSKPTLNPAAQISP